MIKGLNASGECCLVLFIAFAYPIVASLAAVVSDAPQPPLDRDALVGLIVYELIVMAILWPILRMRGWTLADLGLRNGRVVDALLGLALAAACYFASAALWLIASAFGFTMPTPDEVAPISAGLGMPAVAAVSLINPIFEEVFVCGYVVTALSKSRSPWLAIHVSVAIRLAYHLYQGGAGVAGILPMGLISAYWYARTGRLWPVIVAHALFDFVALSQFV